MAVVASTSAISRRRLSSRPSRDPMIRTRTLLRCNFSRSDATNRRNSPKMKLISSFGRVQFSDEKLNTVR
jgi:hypothetical protein